ncbi:hypothetical protein [Microbacterium sp. W4I20]|uniref:hypothetical protein n=1 Tax=Microbacterium sp. W4I20 TaxID=3042262 RepID=UPI002787B68E|nr:hypothetical protein [Microbacterium sp. W4I20]MDQ0726830.1 hypothetical protein [Microbacterium sp. W4I20]
MHKITISDAEAIERIIARYKNDGQEGIFENTSSTIEFIGDTLEATGRTAWFETPGYLDDEDEDED